MTTPTPLGLRPQPTGDIRPADETLDDDLLLSLLYDPDTGAALAEIEALAEDDLNRLLIF